MAIWAVFEKVEKKFLEPGNWNFILLTHGVLQIGSILTTCKGTMPIRAVFKIVLGKISALFLIAVHNIKCVVIRKLAN